LPGFRESLMWFIHSQAIIATIKRPSRTSPGAPSLIDTLNLTNCPKPHNAILLRYEGVSMCPRGRRLAGRGEVGEGHSLSELVQAAPHAAVRR
jgi:hypothetical protein